MKYKTFAILVMAVSVLVPLIILWAAGTLHEDPMISGWMFVWCVMVGIVVTLTAPRKD